MNPVPTYFNGGPFDTTIRMVPEAKAFVLVGEPPQGIYEADGLWGALRQFTWKQAIPWEEAVNGQR